MLGKKFKNSVHRVCGGNFLLDNGALHARCAGGTRRFTERDSLIFQNPS